MSDANQAPRLVSVRSDAKRGFGIALNVEERCGEAISRTDASALLSRSIGSPEDRQAPEAVLQAFRLAAALLLIFGAAGFTACAWLDRSGLAAPAPLRSNVFHFLYARHERPFFALLAFFGLAYLAWAHAACRRIPGRPDIGAARARLAILLLVMGGFAAALAGTHLVMHAFPLSMDENAASFQAQIYARGRLEATLPQEWRRFGFALTPIFILFRRDRGTWVQSYLPGYAGFRSLFVTMGLESLTNPVLAGLTLLAMVSLARRIWPGSRAKAILAALLLLSSCQFLATSASAYSLPAHLFVNLIWLILYIRRDRAGWAAAPWVGAMALGLHNPFPHALFVLPFLARLFLNRRRGWLVYFLAVYAFASGVWLAWMRYSYPQGRGSGLLRLFSFPLVSDLALQALHFTLIFSWQTPVLCLLLLVALFRFRRLPELARDLLLGILLTFSFYCLFPLGQGHGWGYRYVYPVLGNMVVVGVFGASEIWGSRASIRRPAIWASLLATAVFQIPLRSLQLESFVRPFARAVGYVSSLPADVVVVNPAIAWYAQDLVRNPPFLDRKPKIVFEDRILPKWAELQQEHPGAIRELSRKELVSLGYPVGGRGGR